VPLLWNPGGTLANDITANRPQASRGPQRRRRRAFRIAPPHGTQGNPKKLYPRSKKTAGLWPDYHIDAKPNCGIRA